MRSQLTVLLPFVLFHVGFFDPFVPRPTVVQLLVVEDNPRGTSLIVTRIAEAWNVTVLTQIQTEDSVCEKVYEMESTSNHESAMIVVFNQTGKKDHKRAKTEPCRYSRHLESVPRLQLFFGIMREEDEYFAEERYATVFLDSRLGSLEYDVIDDDLLEDELRSTLSSFFFIVQNAEVPKLIPAQRNLTTQAILSGMESAREKEEERGTPIAVFTILSALPGIVFAQYFVLSLLTANDRRRNGPPRWFLTIYSCLAKRPTKEPCSRGVDNKDSIETAIGSTIDEERHSQSAGVTS
uniref:Dolichyl-diphosphooligosaccharide--protein glycosyltransferase 48 kDa subunit n=1 Tax=Steinernema glaseri TaxID=37863 RepID=A0A1I8AUY1_9BILA